MNKTHVTSAPGAWYGIGNGAESSLTTPGREFAFALADDRREIGPCPIDNASASESASPPTPVNETPGRRGLLELSCPCPCDSGAGVPLSLSSRPTRWRPKTFAFSSAGKSSKSRIVCIGTGSGMGTAMDGFAFVGPSVELGLEVSLVALSPLMGGLNGDDDDEVGIGGGGGEENKGSVTNPGTAGVPDAALLVPVAP